MRDITLEDTIYVQFTTRAFSSGVPTQLAGSPVLKVLEQNNATPITSGVSVSVDRASVTGLNEATVVATAANGYEAGKSYAIYISTGTVGGVSVVGEVVGAFTIQSAAAFTRLGAPAGASIAADLVVIDNFVDGLETTIGAAGAGLTDLGGMSTTMKGQVQTEADDALVANNLDHLLKVAAVAGDAVDSSIIARMTSKSATPSFASFTNTTDALEAVRDNMGTAQTGDSYAIVNGASGLVAVKGDTAAILIDTAEIGAAGAGLTSLATAAELAKVPKSDGTSSWNATALAALQSEAQDAITASALATAANLAAVKADTAAILVDTGTTLDAALAVVDANVDAILVDTAVIGAAGAGLTVLATQSTVTAIKAQTDVLTFTVAGELDVNVQSINDTPLVGDGSATPWGP